MLDLTRPETFTRYEAEPPIALFPLLQMPNWCVWRWEQKNGKWTKPPFRASKPDAHAKTDDRSTWGTSKDAFGAFGNGSCDGIGFMLDGTQYGAIDLDDCRDKRTGTLAPWAQRVVDAAEEIGAYAEVTASGEGVRIIGVVTGESVHCKLQTEDGGSVECYRKATRYITVSFWQISESDTLPNIDALIDQIVAHYGPKKTNKTDKIEEAHKTDDNNIPVETLAVIERGAPEGRRSDAFMGVVAKLKRCGWTVDDIEDLLSKHPHGIAAKYEGRLRDEVERCFGKVSNRPSGEWPDVNATTGEPKKTYRNALTAIERLGITCRYDAFHDRMLVGGHEIEQYAGELTDAAVAAVRQLIIDTYGFDAGKDQVHDAASWLCVKNRFDPIRDYLDGLKWDGAPRLDRWLIDYLGVEDNDLHRAQGRLALVAAVARVRHPGIKYDHVLTLEGPESKLKSTAIEVLAGAENFSDQTILSASEKEQQELVRGVWLYELAELSGMRRADGERLKAFVTRTCDRARPAYGRRRQDVKRRCVFIATTNEDDYLKSQTGNRRFWPVRIGTIDIEALRRDRDQLWAEAAQIEATGISLALPEDLWADAARAQEERLERDPWEDALGDVTGMVMDSEEVVRSDEVFLTLKIDPERRNAAVGKRIAAVMRRLGWRTGGDTRRIVSGRRCRCYVRPLAK
jgi:hypothetical protein